jgi:Tfp pilus assembly protein PilF
METKVLTQEEVTSLKSVREKRIQLTENFGVIELRIQEFNNQKDILKEELKKLIQEELVLGKTLQQKYGDGSIDLEKGEFISN